MKNIRLDIQYKGHYFCGSQIQPEVVTVQEELEKALEKVTGEKCKTYFSGRTDSGVHAHKQVVNFKTETTIPSDKIMYPINQVISEGIKVVRSVEVDEDFNSRFSATYRHYRYFIRQTDDLFRSKYSLICPEHFDIKKLNSICSYFIGKHNFQSFCSKKAEVNNYICNILHIGFKKTNDEIVFEVVANRFLHNMIRIFVSVFLEVTKGRLDLPGIIKILEARDRNLAPKTISPKGLFLWDVGYGNDKPNLI